MTFSHEAPENPTAQWGARVSSACSLARGSLRPRPRRQAALRLENGLLHLGRFTSAGHKDAAQRLSFGREGKHEGRGSGLLSYRRRLLDAAPAVIALPSAMKLGARAMVSICAEGEGSPSAKPCARVINPTG
jgi:hypothetical protein